MSRIGGCPFPSRRRRRDSSTATTSRSRAPRASSSRDIAPELRSRARGRSTLRVERPNDEKRSRELHGLTRTLRGQHGHRRHHRLPQGPRDHRRRLPRPAGRQEAAAQPGLQPPDRDRSAAAYQLRGRERPPGWPSLASTRSSSATLPPGSAPRASPSPTRARACATPARSSAARPARPARSEARSEHAVSRDARRAPSATTASACTLAGSTGRPRLAVFRSLNQIYAQVIDDSAGRTLASRFVARDGLRDVAAAPSPSRPRSVGRLLAERAKAAGVEQGRLRPRRLPLPRPRSRAGRCRARSRARLLARARSNPIPCRGSTRTS